MEGANRHRLVLGSLIGVLLTVGVVWFLRDPVGSSSGPSSRPSDSEVASTPVEPKIVSLPVAVELSARLRNDAGSPEEELDTVGQLLYFYRQGFGENPVGDNGDIVAALLGQNEKRAAYLVDDTPSIVDGKLVDRWGTPYWFHPVSGREMEVRSAGPDRELFTGDDLSLP